MKTNIHFVMLALAGLALIQSAHAETKPIKALLLTGGCCHDYATQKEILKKGIEERANVIVDQMHSDDSTNKPNLPFFGIPEYAKGYDVIIHDECAAQVSDDAIVKGVLTPHNNGIPGVNLHCAMHSYRIGDHRTPVKVLGTPTSQWFEYLGLQSIAHGKKTPISIIFTDKKNPITKGLEDWTTGDEELYNNITVFDTAHALATGTQGKDTDVVVWTNNYKGTRVFSTTIGHQNATVSDARYLDLVTRGLLWACGKLDDKGVIAAGYGPVKAK